MATLFDDMVLDTIQVQDVKTRKDFLEVTSSTLTDEEAEVWVSRFASNHELLVVNQWNTLMGRIGSTSISIETKSGKMKDFSTHPSWRPLAVCSYRFSYYSYAKKSTVYETSRLIAQSWEEIRDKCSDTDNMTWYVYKHPHQI